MTVKRTCILPCGADRLFAEVMRPEAMLYIVRPLMTFTPTPGTFLPDTWTDGHWQVHMHLLGVLPLGRQWISLTVDARQRHLRDDGHSGLVSRWTHDITVRDLGGGRALYADTVDIRAGLATPVVALWARVFFRHRQRRWARLVAGGFVYDD